MALLSKALLAIGLVALSVSSAAAAAYSEEQARFLWKSWKADAGAEWAPEAWAADEETARFSTFRSNLEAIAEHNAKAAAGEYTFTLKATKFAHMTNEEYKTTLGYTKAKGVEAPAGVFTGEGVELPPSVDWRTKNVVTPVKNQGQCGSCWAFSAVGGMEGAHALKTGNLVSLSEQELVDCVLNGADTCQTGGFQQQGYAYVIKAGGEESEADYPYTATSGNPCQFDKSKVVATFSSWKNVTHGNETALAAAVATRPTVPIAIDASSFWFQMYSSGVYNDPSCHNKVSQLDHGVLAVGYGMDGNKPYWLVKNSWGAGWGQQGYIWMTKDSNNQCGVATDASFPLV